MTSEKLEKLIEKYHHNVTITGLGDENLSDEQVVAAIEKHVTQCGILYEVHQGVDEKPEKKDVAVEPVHAATPEPAKESNEEVTAAAPASEPAPAVADPEPKESKEEEAPVEASTERSNNPKGPKGKK